MNSNPFALAVAGLLLASCGGGDAATETVATDAATDTAAIEASATPAPVAVQGEQPAYAAGELLPGGAVDVLQREGWRPPA